MCLPKAPKPPKPTKDQIAAERDAEQQRALALEEQRRQKSIIKNEHFMMALTGQSGKYGRASLLTGGKGGLGYATPMVRSLLT